MTVTYALNPNQSVDASPKHFFGLSTDTKPTIASHVGVPEPTIGSTFTYTDVPARYVTYDGTNWVIDAGAGSSLLKTIQTELKAITAVAADVQSVSSTLDVTGKRGATIFIDHAKDDASASVGQGTEYVIQVSEKATGNDTWRTLAIFTAATTVPTAMITDGAEAAAQTVIECGVTTPVVGDVLFFKHATIGSSEWANVIARSDGVSVTLESGLTTAQAQGTYYTQGEHFVAVLEVEAVTRLQVVANNTKGTTNRAICWRVAAITQE